MALAGRLPRGTKGRMQAYATDQSDPPDTCARPIALSPAMQRLMQQLHRVAQARTWAPVLLCGESGAGKDVAARYLAQLRTRHLQAEAPGPTRSRPYVPLNCGGITTALAATELFGHVRGAFTGAHQAAPGAFVAADGGTLFLDEVAELPLCLQPQLLRVLDTGEVRPVGATRIRRVQVAVVAATHRDLAAEVAAGRFRADLWYRLSVLVLQVPPLRQRRADLPALVDALCRGLGHPPPTFTSAAWEALSGYAWPGNVRELRHVLHRAAIFAPADTLDVQDITLYACSPHAGMTPNPIDEALARCQGNRRAAAQALGCSRSTLYRRLERRAKPPDGR